MMFFFSFAHWFSFSSSHKKSASCVIFIIPQLTDFLQTFFRGSNKNFDLLMQYSPKIKVAILNEDKEVISVSDVGTIKKAKGYLTGGIIYNISSNNLKIDYYTPNNNTFGIIVFVFICATIIIFITLIIKNIVKRRKSIMYPRN